MAAKYHKIRSLAYEKCIFNLISIKRLEYLFVNKLIQKRYRCLAEILVNGYTNNLFS